MSVHVAVPVAPSGPERDPIHEWCLKVWEKRFATQPAWTRGYDPAGLVGDPVTAGVFNHARAINLGVALGWPTNERNEVVVVSDADTFISSGDLYSRIAAAREGRWSCPARYVKLNPDVTDEILGFGPWAEQAAQIAEEAGGHEWEGGTSWAGVVVMQRSQFETVGGYDERFTGWSPDDVAFAMTMETLVAPVTRIGTVYHLHHQVEAAETYGRPGFRDAQRLAARYVNAHGNPGAMRALIAERP